jgi:hypothetical protein
MGLRLPPRRRNNRLGGRGVQEAQGTDTGAGTGAGAVNNTRKSGRAPQAQTAPWNGKNSVVSYSRDSHSFNCKVLNPE